MSPVTSRFGTLPLDLHPLIASSLLPLETLKFVRICSRMYQCNELIPVRAKALKQIAREHIRAAAGIKVAGFTKIPGSPIETSFSLIQAIADKALVYRWQSSRARKLALSEEIKKGLPGCSSQFAVNAQGTLSLCENPERASEHITLFKKVMEILGYHTLIAEDLLKHPFNSEGPLQDFRNRARQLEIMEEESFILKCVLSVNRHNPLRFFNIITCILPKLPISFSKFIERGAVLKKDIPFAIAGFRYSLNIFARFNQGFDAVEFYVNNGANGILMGSFKCKKLYWQTLSSKKIEEGSTYKTYRMLQGPKLYFYDINDYSSQDVQTFDRPLLRFLLQLMLEIFIKEPARTMELDGRGTDCFVYFAGGLRFVNWHVESSIKEPLRKARREGKIFPPKSDAWFTADLTISKEELISNDPSSHAHIDFELNQAPITWQQQIEGRPILVGKKPVLPKFFRKDLAIDQEKLRKELRS